MKSHSSTAAQQQFKRYYCTTALLRYCVTLFALRSIFYYCLLPTARLYAAPHHTITIDGDLSEWNLNEKRVPDENDSNWNPGTAKNEIKNLYLTWDKSNLYIGIEGKITNKGILLFLDSGQNRGYENLSQINTWNRKVKFKNFKPDYFYAAWDGSGGNFYRIKSSRTADDVSARCVLRNSKTQPRSGWELKIPFDLLYSRGNRVPHGSRISVCASLATGDMGRDTYGNYGYLGGDTAPNNVVTGLGKSVLGNFASVAIDTDGDGSPDDSFKTVVFEVKNIKVNPVKFSPKIHSLATISFDVTKSARTSANIYDINGAHIKRLAEDAASSNFRKIYVWDGKNSNGEYVKSGVYIINIKSETSSESRRINKAIVVVR